MKIPNIECIKSRFLNIPEYATLTWHVAVVLTAVGFIPSISRQLGVWLSCLQVSLFPHIHMPLSQRLLSGSEHASFEPHTQFSFTQSSESPEQDMRSPHNPRNNADIFSVKHGTKKIVWGNNYMPVLLQFYIWYSKGSIK